MQRSWDTIRDILIAFEQERFVDYVNNISLSDNERVIYLNQTEGFNEAEKAEVLRGMLIEKRCNIYKHTELLQDCNILVPTMYDREGHNNGMRLSMLGYDLLDSIRDRKEWSKITAKAKDAGVNVTWESVKTLIPIVIKELITK